MNWLVEKMKEDGSKNAIIFKGKELYGMQY